MNLKKVCILLLLIAGLVAFSGCTTMTGPTLQTTVLTPEPITPVKTMTLVTPLPVTEIARIRVDYFGMNPSTETVYEFVGKLQVNTGPYQSVQVILRYPDTQEYAYDLGGMGGANATLKPFYLYPDDRYKGTNPEKIIALDGKRYGTVYNYDKGIIAWIATADNLVSP
jgi:ABC-type Fe3+-hydroxamate transport system substrate-binding protein